MYDYLIVGAGYTGSVLAERIASQLDKRVLLVDCREHIGGLAFDYQNEHGILVQKYGLHVFHTYSREVFDYITAFTEWHYTYTRIAVYLDGQILPFPINIDTINAIYGLELQTPAEVQAFLDRARERIPRPRNAEEMAISKVGRDLYTRIFKGYTRKWWDIDAAELPISVTNRIVTRGTHQITYQNDTYQGVPRHGYARLFRNMIAHKNITLRLNTDYRTLLGAEKFDRMIYTGSIDDFFDNAHGRIPYRYMRFEHQTLDQEYYQPCHQVNYPNNHDFMRIFEFKHATGQRHPKTTIIREYPTDAGPGMDRHYPLPVEANKEIMRKYKRDAARVKSVTFIGRLVDHKYYTMGQTVARALTAFKTQIAR